MKTGVWWLGIGEYKFITMYVLWGVKECFGA